MSAYGENLQFCYIDSQAEEKAAFLDLALISEAKVSELTPESLFS